MQRTVAADGSGVADLLARIDAHRAWLVASGEWVVRERLRAAHTLETIVYAEITRRILARLPQVGMGDLVEEVRRRTRDPYTAAAALLADW